MDSIRLTFSSRRIQALINNTYLASLTSFSFFSRSPFSSLPMLQTPFMPTRELSLSWEVFWWNHWGVCELLKGFMGLCRRQLSCFGCYLNVPQRKYLSTQWLSLNFPFSLGDREAEERVGSCTVGFRRLYRRCGSLWWELSLQKSSSEQLLQHSAAFCSFNLSNLTWYISLTDFFK